MNAGWEVLLTSSSKGRLSRVVDMLTTVLFDRNAYDVVLLDVYSGRAFLWAEAVSAMLQRLRKPMVLSLHGGNLPSFSIGQPDRVRRLLGAARAVVAPSDYLRDSLEQFRGDICVIPNPIDLSSFTYIHRRKARPDLVWLRAFHQLYNPIMAVEVVFQLRKSHPGVRLVMIGPDMGDGSYGECRRQAERLGVDEYILWQGGIPHEEVANRLQDGDIFLNTPQIDNVPVSVLEAMASGLCVVSTNAGGLSYLLSHEHDALLVSPGDSDGMAGAVDRLMADPSLASRLSENARKKAEHFDCEPVCRQWEALLTDLGAEG